MDFHKTDNIKTHDQLKGLIDHQINFLSTGEGKPAPFLGEFRPLIENDLSVKNYNWIDKTVREIKSEEIRIKYESDLLEEYKSNPEKWRSGKVKPISMKMFSEWIDPTFVKPLYYNLDEAGIIERDSLHAKILLFHNQAIYRTDEELEAGKPPKPSYIK